MTEVDPDERTRELAAESLAVDDPTGWFERLYAEAEGGTAVVPWDRGVPSQLLSEWADAGLVRGEARPALVVGAGLGRDSEYLARLGFDTVAFDVSETAVEATRRRFPDSPVDYAVADLFDPPVEWSAAYDLVVESMTVQALPPDLHAAATTAVTRFVAPGGTLLVLAAGRSEDEPASGPPWPLTRAEVDAFAGADLGLEPVRVEGIRDADDPSILRWRAEFRRPA